MMITRNDLSRVAQSRIAIVLATAVIVVVSSLDVMFAAYFSVLDYDLGKAISYIGLYPGLMSYIKGLSFAQGISTQLYVIHLITPLTPAILKLGSYLFFVAAFTTSIIQVKSRQPRVSDTIIVVTCVALVSILFFQSTVLRYLGSYGMLVYCQSFFVSALFLYFLRRFLFAGNLFSFRVLGLWLPIFFIGTFLDIRFSFYLCIAFGMAAVSNFTDRRLLIRTLVMGAIIGIVIVVPIFTQFMLWSEVANYRPHHVLPYYYTGPFAIAEVGHFVVRNTNIFIETLGGDNRYLKITLLLLTFVGVATQWRDSIGRKLVVFSAVATTLIITASLFNLYPFGGIRYMTHLFAFSVYFSACGIVFVATRSLRRVPNPIAKLVLWISVVCSVSWFHLPDVEHRIGLSSRLYDGEKNLVDELRKIPRENLWCDIATEKMVLGYHLECKLIATWNYQSGTPESPAFYEKVDAGLSELAGTGALFLFRPIETPFFRPIQGMLSAHGFELKQTHHGASKHLYIYNVAD